MFEYPKDFLRETTTFLKEYYKDLLEIWAGMIWIIHKACKYVFPLAIACCMVGCLLTGEGWKDLLGCIVMFLTVMATEPLMDKLFDKIT